MLKNTLFVAAAAIAVVASFSAPASATGGLPGTTTPVSVPEPSTLLGTLVVGGIGLMSTKKKGAQSNQEQK